MHIHTTEHELNSANRANLWAMRDMADAVHTVVGQVPVSVQGI